MEVASSAVVLVMALMVVLVVAMMIVLVVAMISNVHVNNIPVSIVSIICWNDRLRSNNIGFLRYWLINWYNCMRGAQTITSDDSPLSVAFSAAPDNNNNYDAEIYSKSH